MSTFSLIFHIDSLQDLTSRLKDFQEPSDDKNLLFFCSTGVALVSQKIVVSERSVASDRKSMDYDLKFNYNEALMRVGCTQPQVDALRESVRKSAAVPKSLTNRQVNI